MKLACIGIGQAGGKIVDALLEWDIKQKTEVVEGAIAANTAKADLHGLDNVPEENRVLYGQAEVSGHGVGADNELGAEVARKNTSSIMNALDGIGGYEVDAFLLIAGLGGGTGSGGLPVFAQELSRIHTETPIYGLGILPSSDEGGIYTLNAARSFQTVVSEVDNLILFDNDAWKEANESVSGGYETMNNELARRMNVLFSAGVVSDGSEVAENVVDASEIINTLGSGGISSIGYSSTELPQQSEGLLSRFTSSSDLELDDEKTTNRIASLTREATLGRLTVPVEVSSAERALAVYAGPPDSLSRKGIERGRTWLEENLETMEVRGGDYPLPNSSHVAACILISGASQIPRVKELQQVAIEAQENIDTVREQSERELDELVEDDDDELEPLF